MKIDIITFGNLTCRYCGHPDSRKIAYVLYPIENLDSWLEKAVDRYKTSIAVITGMDWDNDMTPWPAPGVPKGSPTFKGLAPQFLDELTGRIIPVIEKNIGIQGTAERTLVGVSLSGLFTLWQWPANDYFNNIAILSGSFWYKDFVPWVLRQSFAAKSGRCYMILGRDEPNSRNAIFATVGKCTETITGYLHSQKVDITFEIVPGNHYQFQTERLNRAMSHIYLP